MAYAGDISPSEAWDMLAAKPEQTMLVDVRTRAEWGFVGVPVLEPTMFEPVLEEWAFYPQMDLNIHFVPNVVRRAKEAGLDDKANLLFLCRSGVRSASAAAALTAEGYEACFNIAGGFEGDPDHNGHRGTLNGWKVEGLPWRQ